MPLCIWMDLLFCNQFINKQFSVKINRKDRK